MPGRRCGFAGERSIEPLAWASTSPTPI
jgi:hypothetical protein